MSHTYIYDQHRRAELLSRGGAVQAAANVFFDVAGGHCQDIGLGTLDMVNDSIVQYITLR